MPPEGQSPESAVKPVNTGPARPTRREFIKDLAILAGAALQPSSILENLAKIPTHSATPSKPPKQEINPAIQKPPSQESPSFVYLPGLTGGGKGVTAVREIPDLFVPDSPSTGEAFKKEEGSLEEHDKNLANEVVKRTGNRDLVLFGHSSGGYDAIQLLSDLTDNPDFQSKKIKLIFIGTPGFTEQGFQGFVESVERFSRVQLNVSFNEQHIIYPLPEHYYEQFKNKQQPNADIDVVYKDSPEERAKRRGLFKSAVKPDMTSSGKTVDEMFQEIEKLDRQITGEEKTDKSVEELLKERGNILGPAIQAFFRGEEIPEDVHQKYLKQYRDLSGDLADSLKYIPMSLAYLNRLRDYTTNGPAKKLKTALDKAKQTGIETDISFLVLERDEVIKPEDVNRIKKTFKAENIEQVISFFMMEQLAHSSFGYYTKPLENVMSRLRQNF